MSTNNIPVIETPPNLSPCISKCCLDPEDVCVGCFRHVEEIRAWRKLDEAGQKNILRLCEQRKKNNNNSAN
ncbi:MAG: DUF1289 domain-containing protein [Thalassotalea sp.]